MLPDLPPPPLEAPPLLTLSTKLKRNHLISGDSSFPSIDCLVREADRQRINPDILLAVMKTENGRAGELALNRNGTIDLGPMSINTVWLPALSRHYRTTEDELKIRLASDGCANVAAAALILKRKISASGSVVEGVANYHSSHPAKQSRYLMRVHFRLSQIVAKLKAKALQEYKRLDWGHDPAYVPSAGVREPKYRRFDWGHKPDHVPSAGITAPIGEKASP